MKPFLILITVFSFSFNVIFSQKLVKNQKDDFSNSWLKSTTWEVAYFPDRHHLLFRVEKLDDKITLGVKAFPVDKDEQIKIGDSLLFRLDNDSIVKLFCVKNSNNCFGCGYTSGEGGLHRQGLETTFAITSNDYNNLKSAKIKKLKFMTSTRTIDKDIVKMERYLLIDFLKLISK